MAWCIGTLHKCHFLAEKTLQKITLSGSQNEKNQYDVVWRRDETMIVTAITMADVHGTIPPAPAQTPTVQLLPHNSQTRSDAPERTPPAQALEVHRRLQAGQRLRRLLPLLDPGQVPSTAHPPPHRCVPRGRPRPTQPTKANAGRSSLRRQVGLPAGSPGGWGRPPPPPVHPQWPFGWDFLRWEGGGKGGEFGPKELAQKIGHWNNGVGVGVAASPPPAHRGSGIPVQPGPAVQKKGRWGAVGKGQGAEVEGAAQGPQRGHSGALGGPQMAPKAGSGGSTLTPDTNPPPPAGPGGRVFSEASAAAAEKDTPVRPLFPGRLHTCRKRLLADSENPGWTPPLSVRGVMYYII